MRVVGITGTLGAGKGVVVDHLVRECGFRHYSVRELLASILAERGEALDRPAMVRVANELRRERSAAHLVETLLERARAEGVQACVVESVRSTAEVEALRGAGGLLVAVDAPQELRFSRVRARDSETDQVSFDEFVSSERSEWRSESPGEQSLSSCMRMADVVLVNDGSVEGLREKIRAFFWRVK